MSIQPATSPFESLQRLVEDEAAIVLHDDKRSLIEMRLAPVAVENGFDNVQALLGAVHESCSHGLKKNIIESLTTHETSFFREPSLFEALRTDILPQLIERHASKRKLRIWSAACSSGQEPYSLAIVLLEHFPEIVSSWDIEIIASDISDQILAQAMAGVYRKHEVNRGLQAKLLLEYFEQRDDKWAVKPEVQRMISWRRLNLSERFPPVGVFDVVLLRNVMIYFSRDSKQQVINQMHQVIAQNGYLCLGGSETLMRLETSLRRETVGRAAVYRK